MKPLMFSLEADLPLFAPLCEALEAEVGSINQRRFPDGETYLRVDTPVAGRDCVVLSNLVNPDPKFLPLMFLAATLKELGANSVGLVAPYLSYMRQDKRFQDGEVVTSRWFAELLSQRFSWLATVDPHLHRYQSLDEVYSIPSVAVAGAPALAQWFGQQSEPLLLVGPDIESEQWVSAIAEQIQQPFVVGRKVRRGDRDVSVSLPDLTEYAGRTAVVVDDVISSGHTVLETLKTLKAAGVERVDCVSVHGIFADGIDEELRRSGVRRLVTSNSVPHSSNAVDLSGLLQAPVKALIDAC